MKWAEMRRRYKEPRTLVLSTRSPGRLPAFSKLHLNREGYILALSASTMLPRWLAFPYVPLAAASEPEEALLLKEQLRDLKSLAGPFDSFDIEKAPGDPAILFEEWLIGAIKSGIAEAHAMTLSTVDAHGRPDARVLILKDVDAHGWHFASTKLSAKGQQVATQPHAALTFYWQPLGRQVRLRGRVIELSREVGEADFLARPIGSRAGALLARQSQLLDNDEALEAGLAEQRRRIEADPSIVAPTWAVYAVRPEEVEFWQADEERRHIRLRYRRTTDSANWVRERLWP